MSGSIGKGSFALLGEVFLHPRSISQPGFVVILFSSKANSGQNYLLVFRSDRVMKKETSLKITMPTNLLGVDVGFSKAQRTTGIACLQGDNLTLERVGTAWESRKAKIPDGFQPSVIAIDGPLLPLDAHPNIRRHVESVFSRAPFHNRCKPGLSHRGLGLELRQASSGACTQFRHLLANPLLVGVGIVSREGPFVEAFPNAFLGVLMPETEMLAVPRLKRGHRFDWLYDQMVVTGRLESLLSKGLDLPDEVWQRLRSEADHELRAALICLLTAALAEKGTAAIIGETEGGWFWLPPLVLWEPWAKEGLESAAKKMAEGKSHSGSRFTVSHPTTSF